LVPNTYKKIWFLSPDDENRDISQNIDLFDFQTPDADGNPKIFYWIVSCLKQQILEFCCIWPYLSSLPLPPLSLPPPKDYIFI
jgi:hypothetical protein